MKSPSTTVLYDAPGPRARRLTLIASIVIGVLVVIGAYFLVYKPMDDVGEFTSEKWGPLLNPTNEYFSQVWDRLLYGIRQTLKAAVLAIICSLLFGTLLAVVRLQLRSVRKRRFPDSSPFVARGLLRPIIAIGNGIIRVLIEIFRGIPVVITIFFVYRLGPTIGLNVDTVWYLVIGLTIYNMVVIGEILRSGMNGLPGGQAEAAAALGLSTFQTTRMILLPQAFRVMLPALISQLIVVLKDTSLGFLITYEDLLNVGKQIAGTLGNPIQVYTVVGAIYIIANYGLSKLAQYVQHRLERRRGASAAELPHAPAATGIEGGASA